MPIYEYQCTTCGHQLESLQKMADEPLKICPVCQQSTLTRLVSAAGFQLKGSGWYATDYRPKQTGAGEDKSTTETKSTDNTSKKSDTKSNTKSDTKSDKTGDA